MIGNNTFLLKEIKDENKKEEIEMNKKILIIQTGDAYDELVNRNLNFHDMILERIKTNQYILSKVFKGEKLPDYQDIDRVIITGAHSMVTDEDSWIEYLSHWLLGIENRNIPVLGICYGHQLLAQVFNGVTSYHSNGPEIGMTEIKLTNRGEKDKLFQGIESTFYGYVTHSQSAIKLPKEAILLAYNDFEPHQSFKIKGCIYGVQFHPEFTADIIKIYAINQKDKIDSFDKTYNNIMEITSGIKILENFMNL
ncbi:glutamine amidotransferase [Clostridium grantii]|uniref:GMP synthase (Glutamine-hydrolysing) n=1 Tax=Clostridium grantii DSM 8605 TaxID=1121316 RepID=A0A1M5S6P5_9CLOT|nr:glutamine amidotransferase [Clostridium grantii]SHH33958.1 GMP synthase (glutamine-hydrolysing) [Clostridium grantii DSM 8605]